jgi:hypothetical protein
MKSDSELSEQLATTATGMSKRAKMPLKRATPRSVSLYIDDLIPRLLYGDSSRP